MNSDRKKQSDPALGGLAVSALLCLVALAYMARPFLAMTYQDEAAEYPQGYDLWTYYMGSKAFYELGADPYDNEKFKQLIASGALRSDYPDPSYDIKALDVIGDGEMNGYLGSPMIMMIFRLFRPLGFYRLLRLWPALSLLFIAWPLMLLTRRFLIRDQDSALAKAAVYLWVLNLLIWNRAFWVHTILHGQVDALYVAPAFFGLYLALTMPEDKTPRIRITVAAALLALAAVVKIFPAIIILALFWAGVIRWVLTRKQGDPRLWRGNAPMQTALCGVVFALALVAAAATSVEVSGGSFVGMTAQWRAKLFGSLYHSTLVYRQNNPHMAPFLGSYLLYLARIWMRLWEQAGEGAIRALSSAVAVAAGLGIAALTAKKRSGPRMVAMLFIAAPPTVLMHWWNYYNTFLLAAYVLCFAETRSLADAQKRFTVYALLGLSYVLMTANYVMIGDAFPWLAKFINGHELEFLRYELTPYNLFFGYPGALILLATAIWLCALKKNARNNV